MEFIEESGGERVRPSYAGLEVMHIALASVCIPKSPTVGSVITPPGELKRFTLRLRNRPSRELAW
jgi:hypothetical protein